MELSGQEVFKVRFPAARAEHLQLFFGSFGVRASSSFSRSRMPLALPASA